MIPYTETSIIKEILYIVIWFIWAIISILYWILNNKKYTLITSMIMVFIWWFIWWAMWVATESNLMSAVWWAMSLEIMHIVKENWPDIIKQKLKDLFNIK